MSATLVEFPPSLARLGEWGRRGSTATRGAARAAAARAALPGSRVRRDDCDASSRTIDPDVVHTNGLKMHLLGARCRPSRAKVLWHLHDYPDARPLTAALLRASATTAAAAVVANSESVAEHARRCSSDRVRAHRLQRRGSRSVSSGRPSPRSGCAMPACRRSRAGGIRIGLVGTFARWKGHDVFLQALARVRSSCPGSRLRDRRADIPDRRQPVLRRRASRAGAQSAGAGSRSASPGTSRMCHRRSAPSTSSCTRASSRNRSVWSSPKRWRAAGRSSSAERAEPPRSRKRARCFIRPETPASLPSGMTQLVNEPTLRGALSKAGRAAAEQLFSRRRLAEAMVPVYESVTGTQPAR